MKVMKFKTCKSPSDLLVYLSDVEGEPWEDIAQPEGKIGAKKQRKLEAKAEKRAEREVCSLIIIMITAGM